MSQIVYILSFLAFMLTGIILAKVFKIKIKRKIVTILQDLLLYSIIFLMGMNVASIDGIIDDLVNIGLISLVFTILPIIGVIVVTIIPITYQKRKAKKEEVKREKTKVSFIKIIKDPLIIILVCALGTLSYLYTSAKDIYNPKMINILLYALMVLVGYTLATSGIKIQKAIKNPKMIVVTITTVIGTYLGALLIPLFTNYSATESLAAVSGFSWYSLSGVLITDLGRPILGSISFLSNMFREMLAFLIIPLLANKFKNTSLISLSICGSTSMDILLPTLRKSYGDWVIPIGIFNGVVLTFATPILIPFWLGF